MSQDTVSDATEPTAKETGQGANSQDEMWTYRGVPEIETFFLANRMFTVNDDGLYDCWQIVSDAEDEGHYEPNGEVYRVYNSPNGHFYLYRAN